LLVILIIYLNLFLTSLFFRLKIQMDEWYKAVRVLREESDNGALVKNFCHDIFFQLKHLKVKDKKKFLQRLGPEFEGWTISLEEKYPKELVREILNDDEFWTLTVKMARG